MKKTVDKFLQEMKRGRFASAIELLKDIEKLCKTHKQNITAADQIYNRTKLFVIKSQPAMNDIEEIARFQLANGELTRRQICEILGGYGNFETEGIQLVKKAAITRLTAHIDDLNGKLPDDVSVPCFGTSLLGPTGFLIIPSIKRKHIQLSLNKSSEGMFELTDFGLRKGTDKETSQLFDLLKPSNCAAKKAMAHVGLYKGDNVLQEGIFLDLSGFIRLQTVIPEFKIMQQQSNRLND